MHRIARQNAEPSIHPRRTVRCLRAGLLLLGGMLALGGCYVVQPPPVAYVPPPGPVYVAPAPVYVVPGPVYRWGGYGYGWRRGRW